MRLKIALVVFALGLAGTLLPHGVTQAADAVPHAALIEIDGVIMPVTARFLDRGIDKATDDGASLLIVRLDTPGGLLTATQDMVESILGAKVPVVVYVAPSGAHAASAGTFITAAAHVAAMAPGTNIGAATPVSGGGEDLGAKAREDAAASLRAIAEERGRDADALQETVLSSKSYTASEALQNGITDLIASDIAGLLDQLDGTAVQINDKTQGMQTREITVRPIERTVMESFLGFLADPNVAFVLMVLGGLGVLIEILFPGLLVPGITGGVLLALAFVSFGNLPVTWAGVGLLALSMVLFYVELQAPGAGIAGFGGAVSFVLGALLLFGGFTLPGLPSEPPGIPAPSIRVSPWLIGGTAAGMTGLLWFLLRDLAAARRAARTAATMATSLVGEIAVATTDLSPRGTVHVAGEYWSAVSDSGEPIEEGRNVVVGEVDGLTLQVFRSSEVEQLEEGNGLW